jgi:hypothetical protein
VYALRRAIQERGSKTLQKKKFRLVQRQPKLKCPNCCKRIDGEITPREFRQYGQSIVPEAGQLTRCDGCETILEYAYDPAFLVLKLAPKWRVDLCNEVDSIPDNPSLSELVESGRNGRPMRLLANFSPRMVTRTTQRKK